MSSHGGALRRTTSGRKTAISLNEPKIDLKGQYELGTQENWLWITDLGDCSYATFIQPDYYHCYGVNGPWATWT